MEAMSAVARHRRRCATSSWSAAPSSEWGSVNDEQLVGAARRARQGGRSRRCELAHAASVRRRPPPARPCPSGPSSVGNCLVVAHPQADGRPRRRRRGERAAAAGQTDHRERHRQRAQRPRRRRPGPRGGARRRQPAAAVARVGAGLQRARVHRRPRGRSSRPRTSSDAINSFAHRHRRFGGVDDD